MFARMRLNWTYMKMPVNIVIMPDQKNHVCTPNLFTIGPARASPIATQVRPIPTKLMQIYEMSFQAGTTERRQQDRAQDHPDTEYGFNHTRAVAAAAEMRQGHKGKQGWKRHERNTDNRGADDK